MTKLDRLVIINDSCKIDGGASALAVLSARLARKSGIAVSFVTGDDGDNEELRELGVEIIALSDRPLLEKSVARAVSSGLFNRKTRILSDWILAKDTERTVYHLHNWGQILSPSIFSALKPVRARTVMPAHDFALACSTVGYMNYQTNWPCDLTPMSAACLTSHCDKHGYAQKLWRVGRLALLRTLWDTRKLPAIIILLDEAMIPFFLRAGVDRQVLKVASNPVSPFTQDRIDAERNQELLFVGRVEPEKGAELAARAAAACGRIQRVVGTGSEMQSLSRFPNVLLEGWKNKAQIGEIARKARFLLAPARWQEPFGLVLMEAASSGLPVVLSNISLLADRIVAADCGVSVDVTNDDSLIAATRQLCHDDATVERFSRNGFAARHKLAATDDQWWDALQAIYQQLFDRTKKSHQMGAT